MSRVNAKIVDDFLVFQEELPGLLRKYGLSGNFVAREAGFSESSFHRKMRGKRFTGPEIKKIIQVINR